MTHGLFRARLWQQGEHPEFAVLFWCYWQHLWLRVKSAPVRKLGRWPQFADRWRGATRGRTAPRSTYTKSKGITGFLSDAFLRALGGEVITDADANAIQLKLSMLLTFYN
jgi:hypothetical protein